MVDGIPEKFITLPEAVQRLTAEIPDRDIVVRQSDLRLLSEIVGISRTQIKSASLNPKPGND